MQVVALTRHHVEATAAMLARTFDGDAAYRYLFADGAVRTRGLRDFFAGNLRMHLPHGCTYVAEERHGTPLATVTLRPPGGIAISLWTMVQSGLLGFALTHGRGAIQRMMWLKQHYQQLETRAAADAAHGYLHMMAVSDAHQGRGLGSWLLTQVLSSHARTQVVLTTHLERNVTFYRRHGFEVVAEQTLEPPASRPYTVWSMRRHAPKTE